MFNLSEAQGKIIQTAEKSEFCVEMFLLLLSVGELKVGLRVMQRTPSCQAKNAVCNDAHAQSQWIT